jgi:hypothetical protein
MNQEKLYRYIHKSFVYLNSAKAPETFCCRHLSLVFVKVFCTVFPLIRVSVGNDVGIAGSITSSENSLKIKNLVPTQIPASVKFSNKLKQKNILAATVKMFNPVT